MITEITHCKHLDLKECQYLPTCPRHILDKQKYADLQEMQAMCIWKVGCCYYED